MARRDIEADRKLLPRGAIIEMVVHGAYVKVAAVDPVTGEEVSIVGDPAAGEARLTREAIRKLERIILKKRVSGERATGTIGRGRRDETPSGWDL